MAAHIANDGLCRELRSILELFLDKNESSKLVDITSESGRNYKVSYLPKEVLDKEKSQLRSSAEWCRTVSGQIIPKNSEIRIFDAMTALCVDLTTRQVNEVINKNREDRINDLFREKPELKFVRNQSLNWF